MTKLKMSLIFCLLVSTVAGSAFAAMSTNEFKSKMEQIRKSREKFDKKAKALGIDTYDSPAEAQKPLSPEELEAQRNRPLFEVHTTRKSLLAPAGKLLYGKVLNRLVVGSEATPAIIILDRSQQFFSSLIVLGKARPSGTDGRLAIDCDRVVTHSGESLTIRGYAHDKSGAFGLQAEVFSSKALSVAGSLASSFVSGLASGEQSTTTNQFGFSQVQPTGRNAILQGVAQTAADQTKRLLQDATKETPVLVVEADTFVTVYLDEEVRH